MKGSSFQLALGKERNPGVALPSGFLGSQAFNTARSQPLSSLVVSILQAPASDPWMASPFTWPPMAYKAFRTGPAEREVLSSQQPNPNPEVPSMGMG